jgi:hypothetical protein
LTVAGADIGGPAVRRVLRPVDAAVASSRAIRSTDSFPKIFRHIMVCLSRLSCALLLLCESVMSVKSSYCVINVVVYDEIAANDGNERDDAQDLEPRLGCGEEQEAEDEDGGAN